MRIIDGAEIVSKGIAGQSFESGDDSTVPLPPMLLPVSSIRLWQSPANYNSRDSGARDESARPLTGRILISACSLAALCLGSVWWCFLPNAPATMFTVQAPPSARQLGALLADTALLTILFTAIAWAARRIRLRSSVRDVAFLLFLIVPANAIRVVLPPVTSQLGIEYWRHLGVHGFPLALKLVLGCGLMLSMAGICYFHRRLAAFAARTLVFLFPFVPFMALEAAWEVAHPQMPALQSGMNESGVNEAGRNEAGMDAGLASIAVPITGIQPRPQRVVWIIFDEMDYRLAFEAAGRAPLPEFERLARHALAATSAYPPGGRTLVSVPALLGGRLITGVNPAGVSDLLVQYEGERNPVRWSSEQTIFNLGREKGWKTSVTGWYFPYQRIFGAEHPSRQISAWQVQGWRGCIDPNQPFASLMQDQLRIMVEGKMQSLLGESLAVKQHKIVIQHSVADALRNAADPVEDLVFLHLPVPHSPFFWDPATGRDAVKLKPVMGYLDHLQLADRVLGQIRQAMEQSGVADHTTLVISSDHWDRTADLIDGKMDHRIPFLVSFPGRNATGIHYTKPFNTILSRRMISAIMGGEIRSSDDAAAWLDQERGNLAESPYNAN